MFMRTAPRADYEGDDGDRSPWGSFWFSPVPFRGTPHTVTADASLRLTAVFACVRVISESFSTLPFNLYTEADNGSKTAVRDHWLYRLFSRRPNSFQNPMEFRETMTATLALRGNAFAEIVTNAVGEVTDLIPLHPDCVTIEMTGENEWRYLVRAQDSTERRLDRGSVFHLRGMSLDGIVGISPIQAARAAVASGLSAQDYALKFFQNDATPSGGWIEFAGRFSSEEDKKKFRASWQTSQTGRNRHKTAVLENGMKYHSIGLTNRDAQFVESRKYSRGEIATLFRVPPHMIGDLERATFSNIEQMALEFVTYSLMPWIVRWEEAIRCHFIPDDPASKDYNLQVRFPPTALLRGDISARTAYYATGINAGWLTRNEARVDDDRNPLDGLDEPLRPANLLEEDEVEAQEAEPAPKNTQNTPAEEPDEDDKSARFAALAGSAADRVARKETEMLASALKNGADLGVIYAKHAVFVESVLGIGKANAEAYCYKRLHSDTNSPSAVYFGTALNELTHLALTGELL